MAEWFKAPVLKTGRGFRSLVGSNPTPSASRLIRSRSLPSATSHKTLKKLAQLSVSLLFTRSPSSAIIRLEIVGMIVDSRKIERKGGTMARAIGRLTALKIEKAKEPGMYADGGGLYLRVTPEGARNWVLRYMLDRRPRWMGLGPLKLYSLAEARAKALDARRKRHEGIDPIDARRAERARQQLDAAKAITFKQCAEAYINAHRAGWRNHKHAAQWPATLEKYAYPVLGALPVQAVDTGLVLKVLEPIWTEKPETASRLRGRIESILDLAKVRGYRDGEDPARWRGHLAKLLPARSKVREVEHHAALPHAELPAFLVSLREQEGIAARALEFLILTATRTGEVIGARWNEIDLLGQDLDGAGRTHESTQRTPRATVRADARYPAGYAWASQRRRS